MTYKLRECREVAICGIAVLLLVQCQAVLAGSPNPVTPERGSLQAVVTIDSSVRQVFAGGYWQGVDESGIYRVVVVATGSDHLTYYVYVQWLGYDRSTGKTVIRTTVPLKEFNEHGLGIVKAVEIQQEATSSEAHLTLSLLDEYTESVRPYSVSLGGPGEIHEPQE